MKQWTPTEIAENAIGLFVECLERSAGSLGNHASYDEIDRAKAQAVSEVTEGVAVVLPADLQRLEVSHRLRCRAGGDHAGSPGEPLNHFKEDQTC